jgi:RND family efflux transporter MFP subunit
VFANEVQRCAVESETFAGLLRNLAGCISRNSACVALWYITEEPVDPPQLKIHLLVGSDNQLWQTEQARLQSLVRMAFADGAQLQDLSSIDPGQLACVQPISSNERTCLLGIFADQAARQVDGRQAIAMGVQTTQAWAAEKKSQQALQALKLSAECNKLLSQLGSCSDQTEAAITFVNGIRKASDARQVGLALAIDEKPARLLAVSDIDSVDANSELGRAMGKALQQSIATQKPTTFHAAEKTSASQSSAADDPRTDYCRLTRNQTCYQFPFSDPQARIQGAVLIAGDASLLDEETRLKQLEHLLNESSKQLILAYRANRRLSEIAWRSVVNALGLRRSKLVFLCICLGAGLLFVPWPMKIGCDSEVQPAVRRYVASPHDGILESAVVKTGDVVTAGQVLAELDGRQLRMELASLQAELNSQRKQRDSALAMKDVAQSQIANLEMHRLQVEIELHSQRLNDLQVTSPIDGIVIAGDLEKAKGAPLSMGQNLFEISPLEHLLAEIAIPESEIDYVQIGMPVAIKLDAFPFQTWQGTIERIYPQTEIINNASVFVAEVSLENESGKLKPGMKGQASIAGPQYPLGWTLIRKPYEQFRTLLFW